MAKKFFFVCIAFACYVFFGNMPAPQAATLEERMQAAEEAMALTPQTPEEAAAEEKRGEEARQRMAVNSAKVQPEIAALLKELEGMRGKQLYSAGFDPHKNPQGADWKQRVEALHARVRKDDTIALEVRLAPPALLDLGWQWVRHKGAMTEQAKWSLGEVQEAIAWKMEE